MKRLSLYERQQRQRDSLARTRDTVDTEVKPGRERSERLDLGLELLCLVAKPGETLTRHDLACWCGVTDAAIYAIEQQAKRKIANALKFGRCRSFGLELAS